MSKDWTGFIIVIPDQHNLVITGKWQDEKTKWWWKCRDCTESSGMISVKQLINLGKKGMIAPPDGEDLPSQYSKHPDENDNDYYSGWGI